MHRAGIGQAEDHDPQCHLWYVFVILTCWANKITRGSDKANSVVRGWSLVCPLHGQETAIQHRLLAEEVFPDIHGVLGDRQAVTISTMTFSIRLWWDFPDRPIFVRCLAGVLGLGQQR